MTAVIDASFLVALVADAGPEGRWAEEVARGHDLIAPQLLLVQTMNVLRRLEREPRLTQLEASSAMQDLLRLDVELLPLPPFADRVWQLRQNLTCYDAWYVAIAESFELPLATLDRRLARATGPTCRFLLPG